MGLLGGVGGARVLVLDMVDFLQTDEEHDDETSGDTQGHVSPHSPAGFTHDEGWPSYRRNSSICWELRGAISAERRCMT
jgi:hypothetical protein